MKIIGITGGIGSGKSKVLSYLEETYKAPAYEAYKVAHKLQEPGQTCYKKIVANFILNLEYKRNEYEEYIDVDWEAAEKMDKEEGK